MRVMCALSLAHEVELRLGQPAAAPSGILPDILEEFNSSRVLGNSLVSFFLLGCALARPAFLAQADSEQTLSGR